MTIKAAVTTKTAVMRMTMKKLTLNNMIYKCLLLNMMIIMMMWFYITLPTFMELSDS